MDEAQVFEVCHEAIYLLIITSAPVMGTALVVGLIISLLQTLTQIQEATLTFVPKIVVILVVVAISGSFIGAHLSTFTEMVYSRIEHGF